MFKAGFIVVASASGLGLASLSLAQDGSPDAADERYVAVSADDPNWYLQQSTCTLAHNFNGDSLAVVRFRVAMGAEIEFVDPALRQVRQGRTATFMVVVDGAAEESIAMGIDEGNRRGYRLSFASYEILDRIGAGRRLEATTGGRTLLRLDLAGAGPAFAAMRACYDAAAQAVPYNMADTDMNFADGMADEADMNAMDMNVTNAMDGMEIPNAM